MERPSKQVLIDAFLAEKLHDVVLHFLDGKWSNLPKVWDVPFADLVEEGRRRGLECFVSVRPMHEGYWLSETNNQYIVQFFERGTNSDKSTFLNLDEAFKHFLRCQVSYFQLE